MSTIARVSLIDNIIIIHIVKFEAENTGVNVVYKN